VATDRHPLTPIHDTDLWKAKPERLAAAEVGSTVGISEWLSTQCMGVYVVLRIYKLRFDEETLQWTAMS
jgi:hypothetical protein